MACAQVNSDFYRAFSTKNISLMGTVWHKSPHVQCIHPGAKPLVGYDNIVSMWSNMFQVTCVHAGCARVAFALAHRREDHAHHRRCMKRSGVCVEGGGANHACASCAGKRSGVQGHGHHAVRRARARARHVSLCHVHGGGAGAVWRGAPHVGDQHLQEIEGNWVLVHHHASQAMVRGNSIEDLLGGASSARVIRIDGSLRDSDGSSGKADSSADDIVDEIVRALQVCSRTT